MNTARAAMRGRFFFAPRLTLTGALSCFARPRAVNHAMAVFARLISLILIVIALLLLGADAVTSLEKGGELTVRSLDTVWMLVSPVSLFRLKVWLHNHAPSAAHRTRHSSPASSRTSHPTTSAHASTLGKCGSRRPRQAGRDHQIKSNSFRHIDNTLKQSRWWKSD